MLGRHLESQDQNPTVAQSLGGFFRGVTLLQLQDAGEPHYFPNFPAIALAGHPPASELERHKTETQGVKVREMHREKTEGGGASTEGTEVGLSTYPSQEGGGPAGHGRSKHLKTKHKKQQNTEVLKSCWLKIN